MPVDEPTVAKKLTQTRAEVATESAANVKSNAIAFHP